MTAVPSMVRAVVYARDGFACVRCGTGRGLSIHHRRPRGMGGTSRPDVHAMANLLTLCGDGTRGCHGWAESNRTEATRLGFLCPSWEDPADWPVNRGGDRWELPAVVWTATEPHSVQLIERGPTVPASLPSPEEQEIIDRFGIFEPERAKAEVSSQQKDEPAEPPLDGDWPAVAEPGGER